MILLSTLMNDNIDFENTLKIAEKYPNVGLEFSLYGIKRDMIWC